jgi:hypothetical protein
VFWRIAKTTWLILALGLAALWITGFLTRAEHFISTDRYCLILIADAGLLRIHYDGGPDVLGLKTGRSLRLAGATLDVAAVGWQRIDARLPLWMPTVVLLLAGFLLWLLPGRRRRRRLRLGQCVQCGYDLRGSAGGRCSECGASFGQRPSAAGPS